MRPLRIPDRVVCGSGNRSQQVQQKLTKDIKVTPAAVRRYFNTLETDSIPFVPMQVEVQIMTLNPVIPRQEIDDIKDESRAVASSKVKWPSSMSARMESSLATALRRHHRPLPVAVATTMIRQGRSDRQCRRPTATHPDAFFSNAPTR